MSYQCIIVEKEEGYVTLTMNRPEKLNAWNDQMIREATAALDEVNKDVETRVLIITGAGRAFGSGFDVSELAAKTAGDKPSLGQRLLVNSGRQANMASVAFQIWNMNKPVIAAVNGVAAGASFSVAMACDIRIASEEARFSQIFVKRGLIPEVGSTYFLPRLVGTARACEMIFTGDAVGAREAEAIGLVNRVVPAEDLMKATRELAGRIAKNSPLTLALAKRALYKGAAEADLRSQMDYEFYVNNICTFTEDFREGIRAFSEKREPEFKGR